MYEVISTAVDTIENDEGSYFWWPSAGFCCGSFYSAVELRTCLLFVYCDETNEPNEPFDA